MSACSIKIIFIRRMTDVTFRKNESIHLKIEVLYPEIVWPEYGRLVDHTHACPQFKKELRVPLVIKQNVSVLLTWTPYKLGYLLLEVI